MSFASSFIQYQDIAVPAFSVLTQVITLNVNKIPMIQILDLCHSSHENSTM